MLLSHTACFCIEQLQYMNTLIHNNRDYVFDGYMPPELIGGLYLQPPHYIWWDEQVTFELQGVPGTNASIYVFYNDDRFQDGPEMNERRYSGGLHVKLAELGWEGPYSGPQYDVLSGDSHGMTMAMWRLNITTGLSGLGYTSIEFEGSEEPWLPVVLGIVVQGPCEVQVPSFHSCRASVANESETINSHHGPVVPTVADCTTSYSLSAVQLLKRFQGMGG